MGSPRRVNKYKESEFVTVPKHGKLNVFDFKPVDGKGPVFTVDQKQVQSYIPKKDPTLE